MSWASLGINQCISYNNLQDAVNNGIFTAIAGIPASTQQITKSVASSEIIIPNPNYPTYTGKASNQLLVKGDLYSVGSFILDAAYGMSFTSMTGTNLPSFSYPVTGGNTTTTYINQIPAQTITVNITGTRVTTPLKVVLLVNGIQIDCKDITVNGAQSKTLTFPTTIYSPSTIKISINSSACVSDPSVTFYGLPVSAIAISRTTGQYQVVGQAYSNLYENSGLSAGYICTSNDYGANFIKRTPYGYWTTVSISDDGQYMLAAERYGNVYVSSNFGVSWTTTSTGLTYPFWFSSAISNNGTYMYLNTGQIIVGSRPSGNNYYTLVSTNQGTTWSSVAGLTNPNYGHFGLAVSSTGQYVQVGTWEGAASSNTYGSTFTGGFSNSTSWLTLSISSSANGLIACATGSYITNGQEGRAYLKGSTDGLTWFNIWEGTTGIQYWLAVAINNSGTGYAVIRDSHALTYLQKITTLSSVSQITTPGQNTWLSVAISGNGTYVLAGAVDGLKRSTDGGSTWANV